MKVTLALVAATGLFLLTASVVGGSRARLLTRLRAPSGQRSEFLASLVVFRASLRNRFAGRRRLNLAVAELPEILDLMSVSLAAGDGIFGALARVAPRANGPLANSLKKMLSSLELGADLDSELEQLARGLPQRQIVEFTSKLSTAHRRGAPLSKLLRSLAESTRADLRNELLKQAGRNETRMLVPLVFLILPVTVLFAVYPSLQLLNIDYT